MEKLGLIGKTNPSSYSSIINWSSLTSEHLLPLSHYRHKLLLAIQSVWCWSQSRVRACQGRGGGWEMCYLKGKARRRFPSESQVHKLVIRFKSMPCQIPEMRVQV